MDNIKLIYDWLLNIEEGGNVVIAVLNPYNMLEVLYYFIVMKWLYILGC
jgi:hypothetical protein